MESSLQLLRCQNHHVLFTLTEINYFSEDGKQAINNYDCRGCHRKMLNSIKINVYHCAKCNSDLCAECANRKMQENGWSTCDNPVQSDKFCYHGHKMITTPILNEITMHTTVQYKTNTIFCDLCEVENKISKANNVLHCDFCEFDICKSCIPKYEGKETKETRCSEGHRLTRTFDLNVLVEDKSMYEDNKYGCDICGQVCCATDLCAYHCNPCSFDVCGKCFDAVETGTSISPKVKITKAIRCPEGHHLGLVKRLSGWVQMGYEDNLFCCDLCKEAKPADKGVYHCDYCQFDACVGCALTL